MVLDARRSTGARKLLTRATKFPEAFRGLAMASSSAVDFA